MKRIKHLFTALLLLLSVAVNAHGFEVDGIYYNITDESNKTVEVTYKGSSYSAYSNEYTGDVVIPESVAYNGNTYSVTSIEEAAFGYCSGLTSVVIPNSVTSIGIYAFLNCRGLTSVEFNAENCTTMGNSSSPVFNGCTALATVRIGENVKTIPAYAFYGCSRLTSIEIPNSVTSIGDFAFYGCSGLTSIEIPNSVTSIGDRAFYSCSGLTSIVIPNSVTSIGIIAFYGCSGLTAVHISDLSAWCNIDFASPDSNPLYYAKNLYLNGKLVTELVIPDNVTEIKDYAFSDCSGLTSIVVAEGNAKYDSRENCNAIIEKETNTLVVGCKNTIIPNSVTSIGRYAFLNCRGLTSVEIPNSVTSIGNYAFAYCSGLTSIEIPNSVTSIGVGAFWNCSGLTSIVIPNSVTSIGAGVFYGCSGLTSVVIPNSVTSIGDDAFSGCSGLTSIVIPDGVTSIGIYAFYGCSGLTSVEIPNSVTSIGDFAFSGCSGLASIVIPDGVTSIGGSAFYGCTGLTSILIPNSVTSIGYYAFYGCTGLTSILIPNSVTSIGYGAFRDCSGLTGELVIPNSVTSIEGSAFYACTGLTSIVIPNSVTSIGNSAFYNCNGLTSIVIPNSVTSIGEKAFYNCSRLKTVINLSSLTITKDSNDYGYVGYYADKVINAPNGTIEGDFVFGIINGVNTLVLYLGNDTEIVLPDNYNGENYAIGADLFKNNTSITSVVIGNSVTSIGNYAFYGCSKLTSVEIPNSVTSIGENAFRNCSGLASVVIPNSVTSIERYTFCGCSGLTSVVIGNSVTSIGNSAFRGCSGLTSVVIGNSVTSIGNSAFYGCSGLTSVVIGNSVTSIGDEAFFSCSGLTAVHISDLSAWCNIDFVDYDSNPLYYAKNLYLNGGLVTDLVIPDNVTKIKNYAFRGCSGLTSVVIGNSVTSIEHQAFDGCSGLTSIEIPNSVTSIGNSAFWGCEKLKTVINYSSLKITKGSTSYGYIAYYADNVVIPITVTGISLDKSTATIIEGERTTLVATVAPSNATDKTVTWTTSNSGVAIVEGGVVTAVKAGTATITATAGGYSATCVVTVEEPTTPTVSPITSLAELCNTAVYYICQPNHSSGETSWAVATNGEELKSNKDLNIATDMNDTSQQFAILSIDGGVTRYLYHIATQTFVNLDGSLSATPADAINFIAGAYTNTFIAYFDNEHYVNVGGSQKIEINAWKIPDGGNSCLIIPVGEFDPSNALEMFEGYTTEIDEMQDENEKVVYDLNGRRIVDAEYLERGVYIVNGKKVLVK